jgi:hypothetical protein
MALRRPLHAIRSPEQHSRVTNGSTLFAEAGIDLRGPWARRFRDVFELRVSDLGGIENVSEAEQSICRRAATLTCELERMECRLVQQEPSDLDDRLIDLYQRTASCLRRLLESIGLSRRAKDVTDSLSISRLLASIPGQSEETDSAS